MSDTSAPNFENTPTGRLTKLLGYDPAKRASLAQDVLQKVFEEVNKERIDKAKDEAKGLIMKAIELRRQKAELDKKFAAESKKFDKELGKLMNQIEALVNGKEPPVENENKDNGGDQQASA